MKRMIRNRSGTTLVELVVCFALLAVFLTVTAAAAVPAMRMYIRNQQINQAQSVADALLQKIRAELQRMQGTDNESGTDNYIKLRSGDGTTCMADGEKSGTSVEFIVPVQEEESLELGRRFAAQLDAKGRSTKSMTAVYEVHDSTGTAKLDDLSDAPEVKEIEPALDNGILIERYYAETVSEHSQTRFYDCDGDKGTLYDLELKYMPDSYLGYDLGDEGQGLVFTIPETAQKTVKGNVIVQYIVVEITLYRNNQPAYTAKAAVRLNNLPVYRTQDRKSVV